MLGAFKRSFHLFKESYRVLTLDKELLLFPVLSGLAFILLSLVFLFPFLLTSGAQGVGLLSEDAGGMALTALFLVYYLLAYFVTLFFNTALISCAAIRLKGGDPTLADGFKSAFTHLWKILLWALVAATVGLILQRLSERSGMIGKIAFAVLGMAWNLMTFFVVPVLIFERHSLWGSLQRSGHLFKKTWGETVIGTASLSLFSFLLALAGFLLAAAIYVVYMLLTFPALPGFGTLLIGLVSFLFLYWGLLIVFASSLSGIFHTALYFYASTGKVPKAYSPELVKGAFASKAARLHGAI